LNMSIYCYGLTTENPREYLTLHEESVSEIYEKRWTSNILLGN
jgi:hypothetical protein